MSNLILHIELPRQREFLSIQSVNTEAAYRNDLKLFSNYLARVGIPTIEAVTILTIAQWKKELGSVYKALTVNRKLSAVKSYFKFLCTMGILDRDPSERVLLNKSDEYTPTQGLSDNEVEQLLLSVDRGTRHGTMHFAVLTLLFRLGLRRSEVRRLRLEDIGAGSGFVTLTVNGKGNKRRTLPLPEDVWESVRLHMEYTTRGGVREMEEPLFSQTGNDANLPLHPNTIEWIFKKYCKKAGLKGKLSPHSARVTCVSNALENKASLIQVQHLGGWSNLNMVLRYDRRRQSIKNSAVFAVDYRSKK